MACYMNCDGGAMSSYATLSQFLDYENKDLAKLFNTIAYNLSPKAAGLTLLVPSSDFVKDMSKLIEEDSAMLKKYKDSVDFVLKSTSVPGKTPGATTARMFLKSLLLNGAFHEPEDFKGVSIDNHIRRVYKVKNINKDSVELDIGTIKKHPKFQVMESWKDIPRISVWILSGTPSVKTEEKKIGGLKEKKGGGAYDFDTYTGEIAALRFKIWNNVMEARVVESNKHLELMYSVGLLNYLEENNQESYQKILLHIDPSPAVTIFLLSNLVKDMDLRSWVSEGFAGFQVDAVGDYRRHLDSALEASKKKQVFESLKQKRYNMNNAAKTSLSGAVEVAIEEYSEQYGEEFQLYMNIDYMRMLIHEYFYKTENKKEALEKLGNFTTDLYDFLRSQLLDVFQDPQVSEKAYYQNLLNDNRIELVGFLTSDDYLYVPVLAEGGSDIIINEVVLNSNKLVLIPYTTYRYDILEKLSRESTLISERQLMSLAKKVIKAAELRGIRLNLNSTPKQQQFSSM